MSNMKVKVSMIYYLQYFLALRTPGLELVPGLLVLVYSALPLLPSQNHNCSLTSRFIRRQRSSSWNGLCSHAFSLRLGYGS